MVKATEKSNTPFVEWIAAGLGAALALGVIGYSVFEGVTAGDSPPQLAVKTESAQRSGAIYLVPIVVTNESHATASDVEIRGTLSAGGVVVEERHVVFTYVPGKGEARGGLTFERDPKGHVLAVRPEGYAEP